MTAIDPVVRVAPVLRGYGSNEWLAEPINNRPRIRPQEIDLYRPFFALVVAFEWGGPINRPHSGRPPIILWN